MKRLISLSLIWGCLVILTACGAPSDEPIVLEPIGRIAVPTFTPTATATATPLRVTEATPATPTTADPLPTSTPLPEAMSVSQQPPPMLPALPGTIQNFDVVGHAALDVVGWHAGLALHNECAYVGNRRGFVSIIDVSDPTNPVGVGHVPLGRGAGEVAEVRVVPERNLLVVADLTTAPHLYTFDVADCRAPLPLANMTLPAPAHEFFLWQDGERILYFGATFGGPPDLVVIDLTHPAAPAEIARWSTAEAGIAGELHSIAVSPDGRRAYLSLWRGGFAVADLVLPDLFVLHEEGAGVAPLFFPNTHSAVPLRDPRYVLLTSEVYGCPFGDAIIVDTADPTDPQPVSRITLPENRCDNLPVGQPVFSAHNPLVVGDLVFLSWYSAGLQVVDVRDPAHPVRVGQYVPGAKGAAAVSYVGPYPAQTWSYPIVRDGLIYVVDIQSGLHIVRYTGPGAEEVAQVARAEGNIIMSKE